MKKALILDAQNNVINAVVVDENAIPPSIASAIIRDIDAPEGIRWAYDPDTDTFTAPEQPEPEPDLTINQIVYAFWLDQPVALRAQFEDLRKKVDDAIKLGDIELAVYYIEQADIDPSLESARTAMLALFD